MGELAILAAAAVMTIVAIAHFAPRIGVATPVLMLLAGTGASYLPGTPDLHIDPHFILVVVLPPILYSAAITVPAADFRRNFKAISALAVILVIVSAVVTGLLLHLLLPAVPLATAIAVGAVISPPDAVAATSIGKRLGLPPRLVTVLEGEGLVNDAPALVLRRTAVAAGAGAVSLREVASEFVFSVVFGALIGLLVGWVSVRVRSKLDEPVLNTTLSLVVPFLAFVPAEEIHASGVLAVVVAGLVTGHESSHHFTVQDRISERLNWRTIQMLLENGVFLLMGYQLRDVVADVEGAGPSLTQTVSVGLLLTATLVCLRLLFTAPLVAWLRLEEARAAERAPYLARAAAKLDELDDEPGPYATHLKVVRRYLKTRVADAQALNREGLGWAGGAVIGWAGMRGVITVAAAQSLPDDTTYRPQLILLAFTVAVVTLVGQGTTLPLLIRILGIRGSDAEADHRELAGLVTEITAVMEDALDNPDLHRVTGEPFEPDVIEQMRVYNEQFVRRLAASTPCEHATVDERRELRRHLLDAGQAALLDARASGTYAARNIERAQSMLDAELVRLDAGTQKGH